MKIKSTLHILLSTSILFSCSHMKASEKSIQSMPSKTTNKKTSARSVFDKTPLKAKKGAANHELVEVEVNDKDIQEKTGSIEIDQEIKESSIVTQSETSSFLKNKKTQRMQFWIDYFTKNQRDRFQRFINNGEEYRIIIEEIFTKHGLPKDLYFVGLIESGYYLGARSHAAATGPWQFIKGTATRYGLKVSQDLDERHDIIKSTEAAAMYFKDLHNVFLSWELALSAYNAGEYGVMRRIMKHGTRDFYELSQNKQLPSETINYVPKVLAAKHIIDNAEKYGFHIPKNPTPFLKKTKLTSVPRNAPLKQLAKLLKTDYQVLKRLNPELKTDYTPKKISGNYKLRIPSENVNPNLLFSSPVKNLVSRDITPKRVNLEKKAHSHKVRKGDTLISVARKYKLTPRLLASYNSLSSWRAQIKVGQTLSLTETQSKQSHSLKVTESPIIYKVQKGDNLTALAEIFDLEISRIKKANKLKKTSIQVGQKIVLPETKKAIYTVKKGDYLLGLSKKFKFPAEAIIKLNDLESNKIFPGQKLIVSMD